MLAWMSVSPTHRRAQRRSGRATDGDRLSPMVSRLVCIQAALAVLGRLRYVMRSRWR